MSELSKKFGGMGHHIVEMPNGTFRCVVSDFGANTCAAGKGATPQEAMDNTRKVKYGYALRFDFLKGPMTENRKQEISNWLSTLTIEQLEMLSDFVTAVRGEI